MNDRFSWIEWKPVNRPRCLVVGLHGLGGRMEQFEPIGSHLAAQGIATAAWDQRSQGLDPVQSRRGKFLDVPTMLSDLEDFLSFMKITYPETPIVLSGDSMGAQLVLASARNRNISESISGALLYVPVVALRQRNPDWLVSILRSVGVLLPFIRISPKWFVNRGRHQIPLSRVPERQAELDMAPYRLKQFTFRFLSDMGNLIDQAAKVGGHFDKPVAIFSAGNDLFITREQVESFFDRLESKDKTHFHYPEACHDILHDIDQGKVLSDTADWLNLRFQG